MSVIPYSKYSLVECEVVGHQSYGVLVRDEAGRKGFVDSCDLSDGQVDRDAWPSVGARVRGVFLGYSKDERLRLSLRPRDVKFAESVDEPAAALGEWQKIDTVAQEFFVMREARPLLVWALAHAPGSAEREKALRLLSAGPEEFLDLAEGVG